METTNRHRWLDLVSTNNTLYKSSSEDISKKLEQKFSLIINDVYQMPTMDEEGFIGDEIIVHVSYKINKLELDDIINYMNDNGYKLSEGLRRIDITDKATIVFETKYKYGIKYKK